MTPSAAKRPRRGSQARRVSAAWVWLPVVGTILFLWLRIFSAPVAQVGNAAPDPPAPPRLGGADLRQSSAVSPSRVLTGAPILAASAAEAVLAGVSDAGSGDEPEVKSQAVEAMVSGLGTDDGYHLLDLVASRSPGAASEEFCALLLQRLAATDAEGLERWAREAPEGALQTAAFTSLALERCREDEAGAVTWARGLGTSSAENAAAIQVAIERARTEPAQALDLVAGLPASTDRDEGLAHCVAQWAANAPAEAATWAEAVADGALRARLLSRVVVAMADSDPRSAAELAAVALPPGREQAGAAVAVAQRWGQRDADAARVWVGMFPDADLRQDGLAALEPVAGRAAEADPAGGN